MIKVKIRAERCHLMLFMKGNAELIQGLLCYLAAKYALLHTHSIKEIAKGIAAAIN